MSATSAGGTTGIGRARLDREQAGAADVIDVVPGFAGARPLLAVARDRAIDDARIDRLDGRKAEIEALHDAGTKLLDQHIRFLKQWSQAAAFARVLEIDHNALLAPVEQREHRRLAIEQRRHRAHVLAARPFDLDHLGAGLGEHQRRERPRQQRGEIEDQDAGQGLVHAKG